jgi:hypothetical protein
MATTTNKAWQKDADSTAIDQDAFINAFLDDLDASLFGIGANSAKPGSPDEGDTFYDTDASRFIKYNGSAWVQLMPDAANAIDSDHYVDGSIDTVHLSADAVTGAKIADDAIDSEHYTDGSIDTAHLASDVITGAKIADDALDSEHYTDGSIDTAHLAADVVTGAKIADDALDSEHYTDGSIDAAHLASSAVTTAKINGDAVTGAKIADDALDSEHYTDGSIDTAHIADNQVTLAKLSDGTQGGVLYYGASGAPTELAAGTSGYFLKTQGGSANPVWASAGGGMVQQTGQSLVLTSGTTTSTSYVDIPSSDGQVTLTTTGGDLLVWYAAFVRSDTDNQYSYVAIEIDGGSEVAESRLRTADANVSGTYVGFHRFTSLSAASHTVAMRWRVAGNTSTMEAYGGIIVQEIS